MATTGPRARGPGLVLWSLQQLGLGDQLDLLRRLIHPWAVTR